MRLTSFVGRTDEMHRLHALVAEHRLVTLTGPGGVGKTSVAVELARALQDTAAADGVWLVRLAGVVDGQLVARAVADAVGIRDDPTAPAERRLLTHLRERAGLLVLDNCEHLADACAALAEQLLGHCPRLRLLATSREPLAAAGEVQYALPPLDTPAADVPVEEVPSYPAVRLFVDRARSARPGFTLDHAGAGSLVEICRRLDGIPLAIELAAASVKALPVQELAARLRDTFPALAGGPRTAQTRHRTLRATVDWSHRLLTEPERVLLRRLSVFRGGWDLSAAERVTVGGRLSSDDVLGVLSRLVDRSLVVADHGAGPRFHLLETLRHYGAERLTEADETPAMQQRTPPTSRHRPTWVPTGSAGRTSGAGWRGWAWNATTCRPRSAGSPTTATRTRMRGCGWSQRWAGSGTSPADPTAACRSRPCSPPPTVDPPQRAPPRSWRPRLPVAPRRASCIPTRPAPARPTRAWS